MAEYGLKISGEDFVRVDSNYRNYFLKESFVIPAPSNRRYAMSLNMNNYLDRGFLIALRGERVSFLYEISADGSSNPWSGLVTRYYDLSTTSPTEVYIFTTSDTPKPASENYGIRVSDANGDSVFNSYSNPMRITDMVTGWLGDPTPTWTLTEPTGKKYAMCMLMNTKERVISGSTVQARVYGFMKPANTWSVQKYNVASILSGDLNSNFNLSALAVDVTGLPIPYSI